MSDRDESGESDARLGYASFCQENYPQARLHFEAALQKQPARSDWQSIYQWAASNEISEADKPVPEPHEFERDELLASPKFPERALPSPPSLKRTIPWWHQFTFAIVCGIGMAAKGLFEITVETWGNFAGYQERVWTNWYRRGQFLGILTLVYMRDRLNRRNLRSAYPESELTGFQKTGQHPPEGATHFRTADGSWNNLEDPKEGAAGTRFNRNVDPKSIRFEQERDLLVPNPRTLSRLFLTRKEEMKEVPFLNLLAASWIQFQNHGWVSHGDGSIEGMITIPLEDDDDPARKTYLQENLFVARTQPDPTRQSRETTAPSFINEVTHWWDGSQIYGSDWETQHRLRSHSDGKLKIDRKGLLPRNRKTGIEDTGFVRNWWVGLSLFHTLFVREHNAICDHLRIFYPHWDDNRLFNVARLINAAVMAKIHTIEWTPAILPNPTVNLALNGNWFGILTNLFKSGKHRKTVAAINIRNAELGGVVGNPINKHGSPFALSEEFTEVYRLHSLLPEELHLRQIKSNQDSIQESVSLPSTRQAGSIALTNRIQMPDLFASFGSQHPGQLVLNNYPRFMQELSIPGNPVFDLGAVDILRARERGVPRYNQFRRQLGLNPIQTFADLTHDSEEADRLKEAYHGDVENLDLLIGTLAEGSENRPTGFGFGETLFQLFILNATRRLEADRFYTDNYNEETYTPEGLAWVDAADLKSVLLRHHPELADTGLANIRNAFEPWDRERELDPARHPLRAFIPELKGDPWLGESYRF